MDLISKENAVALITAEMDKIRTHNLVDGTARINLRLAKNIIEDMPGIDLADYVPREFHDKTCEDMARRHQAEIAELTADRPQGEWIRDRYWSRGAGMGEEYGFFYKCSMCEYEVEGGYTRCGFNFCPYCGTDMRKGADDE